MFKVVLICIFLKAKDVELFFMYLLVIHTSSSEKCLFSYIDYLLIGLFVFCVCFMYSGL
jgi:hypothetical protein